MCVGCAHLRHASANKIYIDEQPKADCGGRFIEEVALKSDIFIAIYIGELVGVNRIPNGWVFLMDYQYFAWFDFVSQFLFQFKWRRKPQKWRSENEFIERMHWFKYDFEFRSQSMQITQKIISCSSEKVWMKLSMHFNSSYSKNEFSFRHTNCFCSEGNHKWYSLLFYLIQ